MKLPPPEKVPAGPVDWAQACRLVPARYRPEECFERIADTPETAELLVRLADLTGAGAGDFAAMDPGKVLFGAGAGWINAAFITPRPGRFSTDRQGAFYAAREIETSVAEVKFHLEQDYRKEGVIEPMDLEYRALSVHLRGTLHDLRGCSRTRAPWAAIHAPDAYAVSQAFGASLRAAGSAGILWLSLRREGGACAAVFDPNTLRACRHDTYLTFRWNGREIHQVFERRIFALKA
jgi:hypothetical protein